MDTPKLPTPEEMAQMAAELAEARKDLDRLKECERIATQEMYAGERRLETAAKALKAATETLLGAKFGLRSVG